VDYLHDTASSLVFAAWQSARTLFNHDLL